MPTLTDRGDYGIIFAGIFESQDPGPYTDVRGQVQQEILLNAMDMMQMPVSVESAYPHVGGLNAYTLQVDVNVPEGGFADIGLIGSFDLDPGSQQGGLVTYRNDTQEFKSIHRFLESGRYLLQTANLKSIVTLAVRGRIGGGIGSIRVRLRAAS